MPIRFRCSYCNRLLGIATRKAGMQTTCPHCGSSITVPLPNQDESKTERLDLDDVDELLAKSATATAKEASVAAPPAPAPLVTAPPSAAPSSPAPVAEQPHVEPVAPPLATATAPAKAAPVPQPAVKPRPAPPPVPKTASKPTHPEDRPLFEGDVDEILGETEKPQEEEKPKRKPTSGQDALSLDDSPRQIVLTGPTATMLMVLAVVLMAVAFAAGLFLAPK